MAFKSAAAKNPVQDEEEILDEVMEVREASEASAEAQAPAVTTAEVPADEPEQQEEVKSEVKSEVETAFANSNMDIEDEAPAPAETASEPVASAEAGAPAADEANADAPAESVDAEVKEPIKLERMTGNGSSLSPNAQRQKMMEEKAQMHGGGGGGGGIGSLIGGAFSGLSGLAKKGFMHAGGNHVFRKNDPAFVSEQIQKFRYKEFNGALKSIDDLKNTRDRQVNAFNAEVANSDAGRALSEMAKASNVDLHQFMTDVHSGKNRDPRALQCMELLEKNPRFGDMAVEIGKTNDKVGKAVETAYTNLGHLANDHAADFNIPFENNRLVDGVEKLTTDVKAPLPMEAKTSAAKDASDKPAAAPGAEPGAEGQNNGPAEKVDTEKQQSKFMEALDKMKEAIAALLQKIMAKFGMGAK